LTKPVSNIIIVSKKVNAANAALVRRLGSAKTKMDPFDPAPLFIDRASPPGAWLKPARSNQVKPNSQAGVRLKPIGSRRYIPNHASFTLLLRK